MTILNRKNVFVTGSTNQKIILNGFLHAYFDYEKKCWALKRQRVDFNKITFSLHICNQRWSKLRCLIACTIQIAKCDIVYFVQGWKADRLPRIEHFIAKVLRKEIMYE